MLGKSLMPWQRHVIDVIMEIDPITGEFAYSEFGLTVPRQSGKSTLLLAKAIHRGSAGKFFGPRQQVVYTAQTRKDARRKFEEDFAGVIEGSRHYKNALLCHWGNGNEHIRFPNRSRFGVEAPTEKSGHGSTLDEAYIDEAFAQQDGRLEQAFRPAMITRSRSQLGWISTAGWSDASPYLTSKVKRGREVAEMGIREGLAYFEWSAPEGADPGDRDVWRACMPALGYSISEDAIAAELMTMDEADFRRAYLNQWVPKPVTGEHQRLPNWESLDDPQSQALDPVAFAVDMALDRSWTAISVAGRRDDGRLHGVVIDYREGTDWVADRVFDLVEKWRPCAVALDPASPAGSLVRPLEERGLTTKCGCHGEQGLMPLTSRDRAQACGGLFDDCRNDRFRHLDQRHLNLAVKKAATKSAGDSWEWDLQLSPVDISPLRAVTFARQAFIAHAQPEVPKKPWAFRA